MKKKEPKPKVKRHGTEPSRISVVGSALDQAGITEKDKKLELAREIIKRLDRRGARLAGKGKARKARLIGIGEDL